VCACERAMERERGDVFVWERECVCMRVYVTGNMTNGTFLVVCVCVCVCVYV